MSTILPILVGLALVFAGRKLYWFVLFVLGFYLGMKLAPMFIEVPTESTILFISAGVGLLSAIVAVILQKLAVGIAGFLVGGYGAFVGMHKLGVDLGTLNWLPIVGFGIVGVALSAVVFEWALIIISSTGGSYLLMTSLDIGERFEIPFFVLFALAGIIVQAKDMHKGKPVGKQMEKERKKSASDG